MTGEREEGRRGILIEFYSQTTRDCSILVDWGIDHGEERARAFNPMKMINSWIEFESSISIRVDLAILLDAT